ncbi:Ran-binding protein 17 [Smittium mucronatum]|uniref:Ran-binding protein 17 n=1 Tax=Smittium mucronatum TaxID=133383 RepID=A0A1R0H3U7_9FUNG|nr:Ran-binding protein 17 [Smittium mucronatum]OLY83820.1 Ran-binding protein 17 [Smittium mucronatum]
MIQHITNIIENSIGLDQVENYHHMCRLLSRFRSTHTLVEVENDPLYSKFLDSVAGFSITGLSLWEWSENSITPLLVFWLKSSSTKDYVTQSIEITSPVDIKIKEILSKIVTCYLASLLSLASKSVMDGDVAES